MQIARVSIIPRLLRVFGKHGLPVSAEVVLWGCDVVMERNTWETWRIQKSPSDDVEVVKLLKVNAFEVLNVMLGYGLSNTNAG